MQPAKILTLLTENPGELLTREWIQHQVWGEGTFVDFDRGLNFSVMQIRGALGDQADEPRFVETLPRRGYRFIAPVGVVGDSPAPPGLASAGARFVGRRLLAGIAAVLAVA